MGSLRESIVGPLVGFYNIGALIIKLQTLKPWAAKPSNLSLNKILSPSGVSAPIALPYMHPVERFYKLP